MNTAPSAASLANPWTVHAVRIEGITPEHPGVATYHLAFCEPAAGEAYRFEPGQFNMLYLPGVGEAAISLSGDPASRGRLAHTVRSVGNLTGALARLGVGGELGLRGPFGTSWPLDQARGKHVLVMAGGIGLAPLRPAIYRLLDQRVDFRELTLFYGSRDPELLLYERELAVWQSRGMRVEVTVDRSNQGWRGNVGVVTQLIERLPLPDPNQTCVLACGPEVMMRFAARAVLRRGVRPASLWLSMERNMQCAVGLCGHCQLGPAFVCRDGPVFRYDVLEPFLDVESL